MKEEEEERKKKRADNTAGWLEIQDPSKRQVLDDQPKQLDVSALNQTELKYNVQENSCDMPTTELDAESPKLQNWENEQISEYFMNKTYKFVLSSFDSIQSFKVSIFIKVLVVIIFN